MSQHKTNVLLRHMLDHALEAVAMTKRKTRADLGNDRQLNLALVRLLEIIGEAASRIPKEDQAHYSDILWSEIIQETVFIPHLIDGANPILNACRLNDVSFSALGIDLPDLPFRFCPREDENRYLIQLWIGLKKGNHFVGIPSGHPEVNKD